MIVRSDLKQLQKLYNFINPEILARYLQNDLSLVSFLHKIYYKAQEYFPDARFSLEALPDGVQDQGYRLVISLYPTEEASQALLKFSHFKEEWWTKAYLEHQGKVTINLEHSDFSGTGDAWDIIDSLTGTVEGPEDWSVEHDHYIYGTPKRHQTRLDE